DADGAGTWLVRVVPVSPSASLRLDAGRDCRGICRRPVAAGRPGWQPLPLGGCRLPGHRLGLRLGRRRLELRLRLELWLWLWLGWWRRPVSRRERSGGRRRLRRRRILPDVDGLARWQQRFLGHVDDRDFLLAGFRFLRLVLSY